MKNVLLVEASIGYLAYYERNLKGLAVVHTAYSIAEARFKLAYGALPTIDMFILGDAKEQCAETVAFARWLRQNKPEAVLIGASREKECSSQLAWVKCDYSSYPSVGLLGEIKRRLAFSP